MKTILLATVETTSLQLLIEVQENNRAFASYFLNGIEVTEWGKIKPIYQDVFKALFRDYCEKNKLLLWGY